MSGIFRIELPLNQAFKAGTMEPWKNQPQLTGMSVNDELTCISSLSNPSSILFNHTASTVITISFNIGDSTGSEKDTSEMNHSHNHPVDLIPCLRTVYPHEKILQYIIKPISQIHPIACVCSML